MTKNNSNVNVEIIHTVGQILSMFKFNDLNNLKHKTDIYFDIFCILLESVN